MNQDSTRSEKKYDVIQDQIHRSLQGSKTQQIRLKRRNSRYTLANVIFGALAALSAGTAGTIGNAETWKPVCLFSAACSVGVTITARLQTREHEKLTEASECVGQLKALKIEVITPPHDLNQVSDRYRQILSEFPMVNC